MKKKILFIVQLPPPVHGASIMNQQVVQSKMINAEYKCKVLPLQFAGSITDIGKFRIGKLWRMLTFGFSLFSRLISFRPHLVYFTIAPAGGAFLRDVLFITIIKCFRCKRLFHLHGKGIREQAASSSFKRSLYRYAFRNSHVITLASSLQHDISNVYTGSPFILANGIAKKEYHKNRGAFATPVFLYLSNLVRSKGIEIFLQSVQQLNEKGVDFRAIVAGAAFDITLEELKLFIEQNNLGGKVTINGPQYGIAKENILSSADILVFPSYYENEAFPLTILEAMQAEMAVIASDNGAIPEIVDEGNTGYITPMKDIAAIVSKMELLAMDESARITMGLNGKRKFEQSYTSEIFEAHLAKIIKQVLN